MRCAVLSMTLLALPSAACGGTDSTSNEPPVREPISGDVEEPKPLAKVVVVEDGVVTSGEMPAFDTAEAAAEVMSLDMDFGSVRLQDGLKRTLRITNPSDVAIPVRLVGFASVAAVPSNPFEVLIEYAPDAERVITIEPHSDRSLLVYFVPRDAGVREATYGLHLCDGGCIANLTLRGTGIL
jgi:hypothetical protein